MNAGASITRRSAGLPMAISSIVGKHPHARRLFLDKTMKVLFEISRSAVIKGEDQTLDLPQVHAINIIQTILFDTDVSEDARRYMSDAYLLCMDSFSSHYFPIRNCAVMLFTCLVTKTIGAKVRIEINRIANSIKQSHNEKTTVNAITGRDFFSRFPLVYTAMSQKLGVAVRELRNVTFFILPYNERESYIRCYILS